MTNYLRAADQLALVALTDTLATHPGLARLLGEVTLDDVQVWEGQAILCLVGSRLRNAGLLDRLQPLVANQLTRIEDEYRRITDLYLAESHGVTSVLASAGVPALVVKDSRGFIEPHLRPSYDMDLLVPAEALDRCGEVLRSAGFGQRRGPLQERLLSREASWSRNHGSTRISIDLHWHILDSYRPRRSKVRLEQFFDDALTVDIGGYCLPVLSLEHHLLAVCLHTFEHELRFPSRLITWLDVAETIRSLGAEVRWDQFTRLCHEFEANNEVYLGLRVASTLLGAHAPFWVVDAVRPPYQTLGVEQSCFGYWNYPIKYLDDVDWHCSRPHPGLQVAERALAHAKEVWRLVDGLALNIIAAGGSVAAFGQPADLFVPEPKFRPVGDIELSVSGLGSAELERLLVESGLQDGATTDVASSRHYTMDLDGLLVDCTVAHDAQSRFETRHDVHWLASGLLSRPGNAGRCAVRIVLATDAAAQARFLLSRLRGLDAVELSAVVALADLLAPSGDAALNTVRQAAQHIRDHVILDLAAAHGPKVGESGPADGAVWSLLEGLDNRSRAVESLTKFLVAPQGVRVTRMLAGQGVRRTIAVAGELLRHPKRLIGDLRYLAAEANAPNGQRVPPRLYLTAEGVTLTSLRQ